MGLGATWHRTVFKDGAWGPLEASPDFTVTMHVGAVALHYGQACFEGLKAFRAPDGTVRPRHVSRGGARTPCANATDPC